MSADPPETDAIATAARLGAALVLLAIAALQAIWGVLVGPLGALVLGNAPQLLAAPLAWLRGGAAALAIVALSWGVAALTALAAGALAVDRRRGWWLGLAAALLWLPTGCVPLSGVTVVALLIARPRAAATPPRPADPAAG